MKVAWTRPALADLDRIQDFIAQDSPVAAYRLTDRIIGYPNRLLADNPLGGRKGRAAGTRELVVPGTSYIVVYRILDIVQILAVVHASREWPEGFDPR